MVLLLQCTERKQVSKGETLALWLPRRLNLPIILTSPTPSTKQKALKFDTQGSQSVHKEYQTGKWFMEWHHLRKVRLSNVLKLISLPFSFRSKAASMVELQRFCWNTTRYSSGGLWANRSINWPKGWCKVVLMEIHLSNFLGVCLSRFSK